MAGAIVLALYKAHPGKEKELESLIEKHIPILRDLELITDRPRLTMKSSDGTYIEVIEWINADTADKAHEHPAVARVWEAMETVATFKKLADLPEASRAFTHFSVMNHLSE